MGKRPKKTIEKSDTSENATVPPATGWRRLLTLPSIIAMTALTTVVSWVATTLLTQATSTHSRPEDAIVLTFESDPAHIAGISSAARFLMFPPEAKTSGHPANGGCEGFHAWGVSNHGIDAGVSTVQVIAQGRSDNAVLIRAMKVRVLSKSGALSGIKAYCGSSGSAQFRTMTTSLDAPQPTISYHSDTAAPFGFTLARGETETFTLTASATSGRYRWLIDLQIVVDGQARTLTVGPTGGFETTSTDDTAGYWSWNYTTGWEATGKGASGVPSPLPADQPLIPIPS